MMRLDTIINLEGMSFKAKVNAAIDAAPLNEEQAAQWLSDLVFAEQTKGLLGDAALTVLDYHESTDWLTTLFVAAISVVLQKREPAASALESFFLAAWFDSPSTRALSEWYDFALAGGDRIAILQRSQAYVTPIITAGATSEQSRELLRTALMRHVLTMAERYPKLLVDEGLFAQLT